MFDGEISTKNTDIKQVKDVENKINLSEKIYGNLSDITLKMNNLLFSDDMESEIKDAKKISEVENTFDSHEEKEESSNSIQKMLDRVFSADIIKDFQNTDNIDEKKLDIINPDFMIERIDDIIGKAEGIEELVKKYPEKTESWKEYLKTLDTLENLDATPAEIRSAQAKLSIFKGQLLELAVKDILIETGFDVEAYQRVVEGVSGGTRPDIIAKNNTDMLIQVFGNIIYPGKSIYIECKCGGAAYLANQLNKHIPNQLSGQEGTRTLLTTSDIKGTRWD